MVDSARNGCSPGAPPAAMSGCGSVPATCVWSRSTARVSEPSIRPNSCLSCRLTRVHLEEDTGKLTHGSGGFSEVDLNRAGIPLLEIVTEPDIRTQQDAKACLEELRLTLRYLGVSDCEMQEGSLRCDANVNLHIEDGGKTVATPIVEIKNLNSFRAVEKALFYEADRQYRKWQQDVHNAAKGLRGRSSPQGGDWSQNPFTAGSSDRQL